MRRIVLVAGAVGAAVVVAQRIQAAFRRDSIGAPPLLPASVAVDAPLLPEAEIAAPLPFDPLDAQAAQAVRVDDLPLMPQALAEPLATLAELPVDDAPYPEADDGAHEAVLVPQNLVPDAAFPLEGHTDPQTPIPDEDAYTLDTPPLEALETAADVPTHALHETRQPWVRDVLATDIFNGAIVEIHSADTFTVQREDTGARVQFRLWGIDAPKASTEALDFSRQFATDRILTFEVRAAFREGQRLVGWLIADGESLNVALVEQGLARWYREMFPDESLLAGVEAEARAAGRGMWG